MPSVDTVARTPPACAAAARYGSTVTTAAIRSELAQLRRNPAAPPPDPVAVAEAVRDTLEAADRPSQRRVFNLTGTVLHTNLGRAPLPEAAIQAAAEAMRFPTNLEYDLATGRRGERDDHVRGLIRELTGAEDAVVVNNNAAAVLLVLSTLARRREVVISRGELVEIGGSFRIPDVMTGAGARLREVGTTNRTHLRDYADAIGPRTGVLMKVHPSNFAIQGFTKSVDGADLAGLAAEHGVPLVEDLGSGTLVDLSRYGLTRERTVLDALSSGADLVTFSGDKLLGGPQAGIVAGRRDLVQRLARNPLKRALRLDKLRLAALEATLKLYRNPERLHDSLTALGLLVRTVDDLQAVAARLQPVLSAALGDSWRVQTMSCTSQIGSGALPVESLPSWGLTVEWAGRRSGRAVEQLAGAFRRLPIPCIGRISKDRLVFDLRGLDDPAAFERQLGWLPVEPRHFGAEASEGRRDA